MTTEELKNIIESEINFDSIKKGNGIYDIQIRNNDRISIGVSFEDLDDKKDAYVYNLFASGEYINISNTGDKHDKLPLTVLKEMAEVWNRFFRSGKVLWDVYLPR